MSSFPKAKRPTSARILDAWIRDRARDEGQVTERIRLGVGYMVVSAVLARMRALDDSPLFILKGGVAMQLRFEHRARTSADIDMIFRRDVGLLESTLADAPRYPIGAFTVRAVGKPHVLGPTGAVRQPLAVLYGRTPWSRIYLEVSPPEGRSADIERLEMLRPSPDLTVFGLDPIDPIPCMSVGRPDRAPASERAPGRTGSVARTGAGRDPRASALPTARATPPARRRRRLGGGSRTPSR